MRITISERGRIGRRNGGNCLGDMESPYRDVAQTGSDGVCDHSIREALVSGSVGAGRPETLRVYVITYRS